MEDYVDYLAEIVCPLLKNAFLTTGIAAWRCGFPFNVIPVFTLETQQITV